MVVTEWIGRCATCGSFGLCAADCSLAPWNDGRALPRSVFIALLRQRRWLGWPVDAGYVFFVDRRLQLAFAGLWRQVMRIAEAG